MAKNRLTLDVVWQTNAKQATSSLKNEMEAVKRDFESKPLTIDLQVAGGEQVRKQVEELRKLANKEADEIADEVNKAKQDLAKYRRELKQAITEQDKTEGIDKVKQQQAVLNDLVRDYKTARFHADQLNDSYNAMTRTIESLTRAQRNLRSQDLFGDTDKRLSKIRESLSVKAKTLSQMQSSPELWNTNAVGTIRGYGTRQVNKLNALEAELLAAADAGQLDRGQLNSYLGQISSARQQAETLRTNAGVVNKIKPAKGMGEEFITRQQVLRSGSRVIRQTIQGVDENTDVNVAQATLQSVLGSAQEQRRILEERVAKTKNTAAGTKQKDKLLGHINQLDKIVDEANRAIERLPQLVGERASKAANDIMLATRQAEARAFFEDSGLRERIRTTSDKDELLRLRDQLGYHRGYVGKDYNTNEFNSEFHSIQRELQDRMNKLGVKDPLSLKERLFGANSPYGRLYGTSFNKMNHLVTNLSQMNGLSLYGMGTVGLGTAFVRNTIQAAAERESTVLGLGGATNKFLTFNDNQGRPVSQAENLTRSLQYSQRLYDRLRELSKDTGVRTQELAENFSTGYARLSGRGFDPTQIAQIVSKVVQIGRLQGLPGVAIASDIRDFAAGQVNSKSQVLSAIGLDGATLKEFYKKGDTKGAYAYFQEQLKPFEGALSMYRNSIAGQQNALAVEYEKTSQIIGAKLAPTIIPMLTKLQEAITKWAESGAAQTFVGSVSNMASGIIDIATKFVQYVGPMVKDVYGLLITGVLGTITLFVTKMQAQQFLLANPVSGIIAAVGLLVTGLLEQQRRLNESAGSDLNALSGVIGNNVSAQLQADDSSMKYVVSQVKQGRTTYDEIAKQVHSELGDAGVTNNVVKALGKLTKFEREVLVSPEGGVIGSDFFTNAAAIINNSFDAIKANPALIGSAATLGFALTKGKYEAGQSALKRLSPDEQAELDKFLNKFRNAPADKRMSVLGPLSVYTNSADVKANLKSAAERMKAKYPTLDPKSAEYAKLFEEELFNYTLKPSTAMDSDGAKGGSMPPLDVRQTPIAELAEQYYSNKIGRAQMQMDLLPAGDSGRIAAGYKILESQYGQASANYVSQLTSLAGDPNAMKKATLDFTNRLEQASASFATLVREVYKASRATAAQVEVQKLQTQLSRQQLEISRAEAGLGGPGSPGFLDRVNNLHALKMQAIGTSNLINMTQLNSEAEIAAASGKTTTEMLKGLELSKYDARNINLVGVEIAAKLAESTIPSAIMDKIGQNAKLGSVGRTNAQAKNHAAKAAKSGAKKVVEVPPADPFGSNFSLSDTGKPALSGPIGAGTGATIVAGTRPRFDIEAEANALGIPPALLLSMATNPDRYKGIVDPALLKQISERREQIIISAKQQTLNQVLATAASYSQEDNFNTSIRDAIAGNAIQRTATLMTNPEYASVFAKYGGELDSLIGDETRGVAARQFFLEQKNQALIGGDFASALEFGIKEIEADRALNKTRQRIAQINVLTQQAQAAIDAVNNLAINNINRSAQVAGDIAMRQYDQSITGQAEGVMGRFNNRITDFKAKYDAGTQFGVDFITATMKKQGKSETEISMAIARFQESRVAGKVDALRNAGFDTNDAARAMRDNAFASVLSNSNGIASAFRGGMPTGEAMLSLAQPYTEILGNDFTKYMDKLMEQKAFGRMKTIAASTAAGSYLGGQMFAGVDPMFSSIGSQLTQTSSFFTKAFGDYSGIIGGILGAGIGSLFGGRRRDPRDEQHKRNLEELLGKIEKNTDPRRDMFDIRPNDGAASAWYSQRAINPLGYQFGMGGL